MAELAIKVGNGAGYLDGDILLAFSRLRIRCVHAEHICHVKEAGFNGDGLRPAKSLARIFQHQTYQYLFRRVTQTTIERVTIETGFTETFGSESIDVELFLKKRIKHSRHRIFGANSREFWYGGRMTIDHARFDTIWNAIETKTPKREVDHTLWTMGSSDGKDHLFIRVDDMDRAEVSRLSESEYDMIDAEEDAAIDAWVKDGSVGDTPAKIMTKKRKRRVDWQNVLSLSDTSKTDILDRGAYVDKRMSSLFDRVSIVEVKV